MAYNAANKPRPKRAAACESSTSNVRAWDICRLLSGKCSQSGDETGVSQQDCDVVINLRIA